MMRAVGSGDRYGRKGPRDIVPRLRTILAAIVALLTPAALPAAGAADAPSKEYQVKAAMIVNFVQFVEWPSSAFDSDAAPIVIGVIDPDPFGDALEKLAAQKTVGSHRLAVKRFGSADAVESCQVLFVPAARDPDMPGLMRKLDGRPVMTVGETDRFPWEGGMIRFFAEDGKVRFEINPDAAQRAGLQVSSKLMKLARVFRK